LALSMSKYPFWRNGVCGKKWKSLLGTLRRNTGVEAHTLENKGSKNKSKVREGIMKKGGIKKKRLARNQPRSHARR